MIRRAFGWHRPLMAVAALMAVVAAACLVGGLVDDRVVTGAPVWDKPAKFSLSILVYAVSWAWLIARLPRFRRQAHVVGTVVAVALVIEQAVIVGAAAAGTTSHFNVTTPLATALWGVMAASVTVLYLCAFLTSLAVLRLRLPDPALTLGIRAGALIALVGIGLAYLMTSPTAAQLADFPGVAGAPTGGRRTAAPGSPCSAGAPPRATCGSRTSSGCTRCSCCPSRRFSSGWRRGGSRPWRRTGCASG